LKRLKWLTIVLAITFLICVQGISMGLVMPNLGKVYGHTLSIAGFSTGVIIFTFMVFRVIDEMQAKVLRQNEDLAALNAVSRSVAGSLRIGRTMDQALDNVMKITQAIAGEIVIESAGTGEPNRFVVGSPDDLKRLEQTASEGAPLTAGMRSSADPSLYVMAIPLTGQGREIGAIRLLVAGNMPLGRRDGDDLIAAMGAQIAMAVMAGQLHEDVLRRERNLQILYEIAVEITSMQGAQGVLWSIAERAREVLRGDAAAVSLFDSAGQGVTLAAHAGRPEAFRSPHPAGASLPRDTAVPQGRASGDGNDYPLADPSFSRHCAPLHVGSDCIGELCVSVAASRHFNDEERHLLSGLADLAAIAVQKSRLMEQERQVAVLEERERLAREMHDSLAQVLGYLHLKSETALRRLSVNDITRTEDELREMAALAREAYADVREAILGLRETVSQRRGFVDALREYTVKFSHQAGVPTQVELHGGEVLELAPDVEVQLMRVIQEALTNVRKHAGARKACVRVDHRDGLQITIEDDGKGFDPAALDNDRDRFGLFTMRERLERVGGRLEIDSAIGRGTRVCVIFSDAEAK
jgi:two-component system nitrate/nitrite sensor histidine kinase NarX